MMSFSLTSCPRCMQSCSPLGQPGTWSFSFNVPSWSTEYVCGQCGVQPWFECCHSSCRIPLRKNVFHTLKQLRAHARHWHVQLASPEENCLVLDTCCSFVIRRPYTGEMKTGCSCWENNICSEYMLNQTGDLGPPGAFVSLRPRSVKLSFHCNRSLRKDGKTWNSNKPL
jgi:hypothetical protein